MPTLTPMSTPTIMRLCTLLRSTLPALLFVLVACSRSEAPPPPTPRPSRLAAEPGASPTPAGARDVTRPSTTPKRPPRRPPTRSRRSSPPPRETSPSRVTRAWAPNGADRFYNLVKVGYYDGVRFYRAVEGFMVQFGINGDPAANGAWYKAHIPTIR